MIGSTAAKCWLAGAVLHACCVFSVWILWDSSRGGRRLPHVFQPTLIEAGVVMPSPRGQLAMAAAGAADSKSPHHHHHHTTTTTTTPPPPPHHQWRLGKKACDADPAVRLRSAFVDRRREALQRFHASPCGSSPARWGNDNCTTHVDSDEPLAVVVGMAEAKIHTSPDQALVACVVEVPGTADAIAVGEARLRNLTVSHPKKWQFKNFKFLTHVQAQMLCVVPALAVGAAIERGAADLRVRLVYEGCEEHRSEHAVVVRPDQHIPAAAAGTVIARGHLCGDCALGREVGVSTRRSGGMD